MASKGLDSSIRLDRRQPHGRTFFGEGKPRASDAKCVYFQHGLYFDADGALVDNDHNRDVLASRAPKEAVAEKHTSPRMTPAQYDKLEGESDENVYRIAVNLVNKLALDGNETDYEPSVEAREDNIRFIAEHA